MKRLFLLALLFVAGTGSLSAQNYMVVDSEKVFKSIDDYNTAIDLLNELAKAYQEQVNAKFDEVESLYNDYMEQKNSLSSYSQSVRENLITQKEQEAIEYQESIFGKEGALMKKRLELIQPIQKKVFDAIEQYATLNGYDLVLDSAANPTMLYKSEKVDQTDAVIELLKKQ
ncbi:MAG TPA: OmpH family outer membrane protein [Candidatus Alistipes avicola]|uniref:OmpH family outer membrane protein n=1 Tax=Candidatus Alistipes avicola TaxID=2838432 RepID=A0A9D2RHE5_9BACT|nr:OmpH family outer membrane protein [uncultured Alistipes sp.]HJA99016.1 OmpH family outer membrane protein [Candidatus Alistipes avicola]